MALTLVTSDLILGLDYGKLTGTIPTWNQNTTGNADTATLAAGATILATARNINSVAFDGSADITIVDATKLPLAGGTLTGTLSGTSATFSSSVTAQTGEFISGSQDGAGGSVVRISTTSLNAAARNWGIVNTWDNFGDLTFRVSNAQGGNALLAGTSKMVLFSSGNVGIGDTTDTGFKLRIHGADGTSYLKLTSTAATTGGRIGYNGNVLRIDQQENSDIEFRTNGSEKMRISSRGAVRINNSLNIGSGDESNYPLQVRTGTDQILRVTDNVDGNGLQIAAGTDPNFGAYTKFQLGNGWLRFSSGGIVGIGSTGIFAGTNAILNLQGSGIALKNDKNGSNNNWSYIQNTGTGSSSDINFYTGNNA